MPISLQTKLPKVGSTIFSVMSKLARDHQAINLSQGFPSFDPPPLLQERVTAAIQNGHNQYPPMAGVPPLLEQIAAKVQRQYGRTVSTDTEINVACGATEALFSAISAVVRPGDEVILFDPAYDSYEPAIELNGGRAIHLPLTRPEFAIDWQRVRDTITDRTRLIILNIPHNPSGALLNQSDLDTLAEIVRDTDILLASDEVYEHIVFDGQKHLGLLNHDELAERSYVITSFGKTYHITGWKLGYCIAPPALMTEFRKVHQYVVFTVPTPFQFGVAEFMAHYPTFEDELADFYQQKRDVFAQALAGSRFKLLPSPSTFYQLVDYSDLTDLADVEYARHLTTEVGVASIPVSVFCEQTPETPLLRFCFAKPDEMLIEAGQRLSTI